MVPLLLLIVFSQKMMPFFDTVQREKMHLRTFIYIFRLTKPCCKSKQRRLFSLAENKCVILQKVRTQITKNLFYDKPIQPFFQHNFIETFYNHKNMVPTFLGKKKVSLKMILEKGHEREYLVSVCLQDKSGLDLSPSFIQIYQQH